MYLPPSASFPLLWFSVTVCLSHAWSLEILEELVIKYRCTSWSATNQLLLWKPVSDCLPHTWDSVCTQRANSNPYWHWHLISKGDPMALAKMDNWKRELTDRDETTAEEWKVITLEVKQIKWKWSYRRTSSPREWLHCHHSKDTRYTTGGT